MTYMSSTQEVPEHGAVPRHLAIIMDGNGRWARSRLLPRLAGHRRGLEAVRATVENCAERYTRLSFDEAIIKNLRVMDATALTLCRDQKLPINVFSIFKKDALRRVVLGEDEGTLVHV